MSQNLKKRIVSGVFWQVLEKLGSHTLNFLVTIILVRLLAPDEFGMVFVMMGIVEFGNICMDLGFSSAIIQKKDLDDLDCCSVFWGVLLLSCAVYAVLYFTIPFLGKYYDFPMAEYLRVLSLLIIIRSFALIQGALLVKRMLFHFNFKINMIALVCSGSASIFLAYNGFGIWALVIQKLIHAFVVMILQWWYVRWIPALYFNFERLKKLFSFGGKIFTADILAGSYNALNSAFFGAFFKLSDIGYNGRGNSIPAQAMQIVNGGIDNVMFSAFSEMQNDVEKKKIIMRNALECTMFVLIPMMALLFVFAPQITVLLFTEKWLPSVYFMRLACVASVFWPLYSLNYRITSASGKSNIVLSLEILKKLQRIIVIAVVWRLGYYVTVTTMTALLFIEYIENCYPTNKIIQYSCLKQIKDIIPSLTCSVVAGCAGYLTGKLFSECNVILLLCAGGVVFSLCYIALMFLYNQIPEQIIILIKSVITKIKMRNYVD